MVEIGIAEMYSEVSGSGRTVRHGKTKKLLAWFADLAVAPTRETGQRTKTKLKFVLGLVLLQHGRPVKEKTTESEPKRASLKCSKVCGLTV